MNNTEEKIRKKAEKIYFAADEQEQKMFNSRLFKKHGLAQVASGEEEKKKAKEVIRTADIELAKQIIEIDRLYINVYRLYKLDRGRGVQYYQRINIYKHICNLEQAMAVLESGIDVPEFDEKLREYNDYIENHIVRGKNGKTFRTLSKTDLRKPPKDENGRPQAVGDLLINTKTKYQDFGSYFVSLKTQDENKGQERTL